MHYARVQVKGKMYYLGRFISKEIANATRQGALTILEKLNVEEKSNDKKEYEKHRNVPKPKLEVLEKMINTGVFDDDVEVLDSLGFAINRRREMVMRMRTMTSSKINLSSKEIAEISSSGVGEHI
jgi:hypothetical protein